MPSSDEEAKKWSELIKAAAPKSRPSVSAVSFVKRFQSCSAPTLLDCSDGSQYVVKALRHDSDQGRMMFNDQVVALAGSKIGAPVPAVSFVDVPKELIDLNPCTATALGHIKPGLAHGSRWIRNVSDDRVNDIVHADKNKERFGVLSVLYGLMQCSDRQFIYENAEPYKVYSHDHGHFFPGGPNWTIGSLSSAASPALDNDLIAAAGLSPAEIAKVCSKLSDLTDSAIASILALPPGEWGVSLDDRAHLGAYIAKRRDTLLNDNQPQAKQG